MITDFFGFNDSDFERAAKKQGLHGIVAVIDQSDPIHINIIGEPLFRGRGLANFESQQTQKDFIGGRLYMKETEKYGDRAEFNVSFHAAVKHGSLDASTGDPLFLRGW